MPQPTAPRVDPFSALRVRNYRFYILGSVVGFIGAQLQAGAVAVELFQRTHDPMAVGWIGLARFLPVFLLGLPAGQLADRYNRKFLLAFSQAASVIFAIALYFLSQSYGTVEAQSELVSSESLWPYYAILFLRGCSGTMGMPPRQALLPQIVPADKFANAVTWNSGLFHLSVVIGPALVGIFIGNNLQHVHYAYLIDAATMLMTVLLTLRMRLAKDESAREPITFSGFVAGLRFVFVNKIILATLTLDLFAVLFGGATALIPIYANDILNCNDSRYGLLLAAPGLGSIVTAVLLLYLPTMRRAGVTLLWAVAGYGAATIVFGFSTTLWLALAALFMTGMFDQISVVVRHTLVQLSAPDRMRGRISAVNGIFIQSSNQLGDFESGVVAALVTGYVLASSASAIPDAATAQHARAVGACFSAVSGGVGTIIVVIIVTMLWPQLRRIGALHEVTAADEAEAEREEKIPLS